MIDLSQLVALIPGPWGVFAGIAITLAGQFIRNRLAARAPAATPATPSPVAPAPAIPAGPVAPSSHPRLDAFLAFLRTHLTTPAPAPFAPDLTHENLGELLGKLFPNLQPPAGPAK